MSLRMSASSSGKWQHGPAARSPKSRSLSWSARLNERGGRISTAASLRLRRPNSAPAISRSCARSRGSVADRGEVLRLKRRLGFAAKGEAESVVVVQADPLNAILPTLLVVPLDPAVGSYGNHPAVLRVSREEAGSRVEHVAVPWRLRAIS